MKRDKTILNHRLFTKTLYSWVLLSCLFSYFALEVQAAESERWVLKNQPSINVSQQFSVFRNSGESLTLEAVRSEKIAPLFVPVGPNRTTNFGLTQDEIWLHLTFDTAEDIPKRWFLEVVHPSLDVIELYYANQQDDQFHSEFSGDSIAFNEKPFAHFSPIFELQLLPNQTYTLYLKVRSQGTLTVPLRLWQPDALWQFDQTLYSILSLYYGILLGLLVYNLFIFFSLRDRIYLIYSAFISFLGLGLSGLSGLSYQFLFPESVWFANLMPTGGLAVSGIFGALFVHQFLLATLNRFRLSKLMYLFSFGYAIIAATTLLGYYHYAAIAINFWSLAFALSALILGIISLYLKQPGSRFFVLAWISLLLGIIVIALHNVGILPSNFFTTNALWIGSALEMLLLAMALADRINELQYQQQLAKDQALQIKQQMINTVKENERLLETRVQERTQELALVNQRLIESEQKLMYQANHDALTGLANRHLLEKNIHDLLAKGNGFTVMAADLDQFKPINDRYGHAVGDQVLVILAERLKALVENPDQVARIGGDEFVVVLPKVTQPEEADRICLMMQEAICQPSAVKSGLNLNLHVSIGFAIYPQDADTLDALLLKADQAMYQNKHAKLVQHNQTST